MIPRLSHPGHAAFSQLLPWLYPDAAILSLLQPFLFP